MEETEEHSKNWYKQIWHLVKKYKWVEIAAILIFLVLLWAPSVYANLSTRDKRYNLAKTPVQNVPKKQVAIVLGAGILPNGEPTPYLRWRVETAVKLYKTKGVQKILMSGDNSTKHHNEPKVMKELAIKEG